MMKRIQLKQNLCLIKCYSAYSIYRLIVIDITRYHTLSGKKKSEGGGEGYGGSSGRDLNGSLIEVIS